MKVWLDDRRPAPKGWRRAKTADEAIRLLDTDEVEIISFDHDLGTLETGYTVAEYLEYSAASGTLERVKWRVHSANPVGRKRIEVAMHSAERFWDKWEASEMEGV